MKFNILRKYLTDLTNSQWEKIERLLPKAKSGPGLSGRPSILLRIVINGILYVNKTGCQWRMLPKEYGNWNTIFGYFNRWSKTWVLGE